MGLHTSTMHSGNMRKLFPTASFLFLAFMLAVPNQAAGAAELTIYVEQNQFPQNADGELQGVFPEVIRELIKRTGTKTGIVEASWRRGYSHAQTQRNAALVPTTRTAQREKLFEWLGPVQRIKWIFFKRRGRLLHIKSLDDARKVRAIGTYGHDAREQYLKEQGFTNLHSTNHQVLNIRKLLDNRIDLLVGTNLGIADIMELAGYDPDEVEPAYTFRQADLYIAFSLRTSPLLLKGWKEAFEGIKRDGTFAKIYQKYAPEDSPPLTPLPQTGQP